MTLSESPRAAVDRLVETAIAHGGRAFRAVEDMGFMYCRAVADLDGHVRDLFHMDLDAFATLQAGA